MADNFAQSAVRHWKDAVTLESAGRVENADQLFGFAAECGIKSALVEYPAVYRDGVINERYKKHINELWGLAALQSMQRRFPGLLAVLRLANPFHDWSTNQRYGADNAISGEAVQRHKNSAKRILGSVGLLGTRGER